MRFLSKYSFRLFTWQEIQEYYTCLCSSCNKDKTDKTSFYHDCTHWCISINWSDQVIRASGRCSSVFPSPHSKEQHIHMYTHRYSYHYIHVYIHTHIDVYIHTYIHVCVNVGMLRLSIVCHCYSLLIAFISHHGTDSSGTAARDADLTMFLLICPGLTLRIVIQLWEFITRKMLVVTSRQ